MKKRLPSILIGLLFLVGLGIMIYPTVSNQWNTYRQNKLISNYEKIVDDMSDEDFSQEWQNAQAFNETISGNNVFADVFGEKSKDSENSEYNRVLNMNNDGIMGYISIPEINIKLAIYHGTSEGVLQIAVGHIEGSSLPVGGMGTHCVLSGHRGLPSARLFTDLNKVEEGDRFFLRVLDETLTYEVDQIHIVEPNDLHYLEIEKGQDLCTLVTCTPYGINSHRLLVRGHRVANDEDDSGSDIRVTADAIQIDPLLVTPVLAIPMLLVGLFLLLTGKGQSDTVGKSGKFDRSDKFDKSGKE